MRFLIFSLMLVATLSYASPEKFRAELQYIQKKYPPIQGGVFFYGSSTFSYWNDSLKKDFPTYSVVPRGFGGSTFKDALYFLDEYILAFKPKIIFIYEGDNDIAVWKDPDSAFLDAKSLYLKVKSKSPETKVAFVSVKPSVARKIDYPLQFKFNTYIYQFCKNNDCAFIDIVTPMLDSNQKLIEKYYEGTDGLHFNRSGYELWKPIFENFIKSTQ